MASLCVDSWLSNNFLLWVRIQVMFIGCNLLISLKFIWTSRAPLYLSLLWQFTFGRDQILCPGETPCRLHKMHPMWGQKCSCGNRSQTWSPGQFQFPFLAGLLPVWHHVPPGGPGGCPAVTDHHCLDPWLNEQLAKWRGSSSCIQCTPLLLRELVLCRETSPHPLVHVW